MEGDVLGHMGAREECVRTLVRLAARLEEFRLAHPRRKLHFTLLSDHGIDFRGMPASHFLDYQELLPTVGITPVSSLAGNEGVYAVPILHVRLMYFAMHTRPELVPEVGRRVTELESVDFAVGRLGPSRYALWCAGRLVGSFDYEGGAYSVVGDLSRFGVPVGASAISDEALFAASQDSEYPDLLYRVRTALSDRATEFPADVMVSVKSGWQSGGAIPRPNGGDEFSPAGTHGGANADGIGILITEERDLPGAVRADAFLDLFPRAAEHLRQRGLTLLAPDPDATRPHR